MRKLLCLLLMLTLLPCTAAWGAEDYNYANEPTAYTKITINNRTVRYAIVDINNTRVTPTVLNAQNQLLSTQSVGDMAKACGASIAINGAYFEAYNGTPVPWGLLIKDGRLMHIGNNGLGFIIQP